MKRSLQNLVPLQTNSAANSVDKIKRCEMAANSLHYASACASILEKLILHPLAIAASKALKISAVATKAYCHIFKRQSAGESHANDKAAHFAMSALHAFYHAFETGISTGEVCHFIAFMDKEVNLFSENRWGAISFEDAFVKHVRALAEEHEWPLQVENKFSTLFLHHTAKHIAYDEAAGFKITPPSFQPYQFDESALENIVMRTFDHAIHELEPKLSTLLEEHFISPVIRSGFQNNMTLAAELFSQLTEAATVKMQETLESLQIRHTAQFTARKPVLIDQSSLMAFRDIASMMQDGAMLATIFQQPAIAKSLSSAGSGIERAVSGIEKINTTTALLSHLSGVVSLFTGIASIASAAAGLFSNDHVDQLNTQLNRLSEQVSHLGKQLDCVLKNQMIMVDMLGGMQRRIFEMDQRLIQFIRTTNANFEFLKMKELNEAYDKIDFHLQKINAIQLTDGELRQKLMILETWLRSPYSSSSLMNGALYANVSSAEALETLTQAADNAASMHMFGFVLTRLKHHRIAIPPEFFQLPPFQLYFQITRVFTLGVEALKPASDDGCRSLADELGNQFTLFSNMLNFLEKNDEMWKRLQQQYLTHLTEAKVAIYKLDDADFELYRYERRDKLLQTWLDKVPHKLSSQKEYFFDQLNAMEEVRLLLVILSQWTHRFNSLVSSLPSKKDTLAMEVPIDSSLALPDYQFYFCSISDTGSANWTLTNSKQYRYHTAVSTITQGGLFSKPFQNPFRTLTQFQMNWFFESRQYEPMILHVAADTRAYYFYQSCVFSSGNLASPYDRPAMDLARDARYEFIDLYENGTAATNFMVLFALFAVDKLSALRNAYQYYTAYHDGDTAATEKRRATVDPTILLWLTAILGRYDIFLSVQKPDSFDFLASVSAKKIGGYKRTNVSPGYESNYHTTVEDDQYILGDGNYLKSLYSYTSPIIPLMIAAKFNRVDVVEGLLREYTEHNKDIGLLKKDCNRRTPAQIALYHGHYALSKLLDRYNNTLSQSEREIVAREVEKNTTLEGTTKGAIADALKLGGMFARRLRENCQHGAVANAAASASM